MIFKKLAASLLTGAMLLGATIPAFAGTQITASGSSAILPLAKTAAEFYMDNNPGVTVNVSGGGSFTGLKQVAEGAVDIGNSDVPAESGGYTGLVAEKVAVAPFVIITHPANSVSNLTQQQMIDIFTGKVTNWKQVGGKDQAITIIGRSKTSGSRATIKTIVLKGQEFTDSAVIQDSNGAVRTGVATTLGSIGYVDAPYLNSSIKAIKYNGVAFSDDNVISGKYPIWTYEYMYTKGNPQGDVKKFIEMVASESFQETFVDRLGFIPMSKMQGKKAQTENNVKTPVKKPVVKKTEIKRTPGSTFVANNIVWKVAANGKHIYIKTLKRKVGTTFVANGKLWKVGTDGKHYFVKVVK